MTPPYLGYAALIHHYRLQVPPLLSIWSVTDKAVESRTLQPNGEERIELPRQRVRGGACLADRLTFAFKRETLNLTVLAALFDQPGVLQELQAWLAAKPSSKYARIAGHLAQWLTGHIFDYRLPKGCPRVPLLDPAAYVTGPGRSCSTFGILHNLLGDVWFSPLIRRTPRLQNMLSAKLAEQVKASFQTIEPEMLSRAVDYLYLSETRSTYGIEDEVPDHHRAMRFRHLLEQAGEPGPLTEEQLGEWQAQVIDPRCAEYHYRQGQNWLSRPGRFRNIADFIPPPAEHVHAMMASVAELAQNASSGTLDPVLAAACAAFGMVFVHPFWDGNGRLHRFLLHHILRQSGFTPRAVVLPLSARMLKQLDRYSALLKQYSRPRTELLDYSLDSDSATLRMKSMQPRWLYAYHDFTDICEFIYECCEACVSEDLQMEVLYLRAHDATIRELETWLDMRQAVLNTLVDVIVQGNGTLSKRKLKLVEGLSQPEIQRIEECVNHHFAEFLDRRNIQMG